MGRPTTWLAIELLLLAFATHRSSAQDAPGGPEPAPVPVANPSGRAPSPSGFVDRSGFLFGIGAGLGAYESRPVMTNIPYGQAGFRFQAEIGYSFMQRFSLIGDLALSGDTETDPSGQNDVSQSQLAIELRYFMEPSIWVQAGIGRGSVGVTPSGTLNGGVTASGTAFPFGIGAEFYRTPTGFTLSVAFQGALYALPLANVTGEHTTTYAVPVALNLMADWY